MGTYLVIQYVYLTLMQFLVIYFELAPLDLFPWIQVYEIFAATFNSDAFPVRLKHSRSQLTSVPSPGLILTQEFKREKRGCDIQR